MKKKIKEKKKIDPIEKRSVWTFFTLLFPSLMLGLLAVGLDSKLTIGILLFFYQAVILKNFVETYYGKTN
jgi:hypothetical protein